MEMKEEAMAMSPAPTATIKIDGWGTTPSAMVRCSTWRHRRT